MDHKIVLAALRLLTRVVEASKALLELLRHIRDGNEDANRARVRLRHLKRQSRRYCHTSGLAKDGAA